jgi:hypothetical protein
MRKTEWSGGAALRILAQLWYKWRNAEADCASIRDTISSCSFFVSYPFLSGTPKQLLLLS